MVRFASLALLLCVDAVVARPGAPSTLHRNSPNRIVPRNLILGHASGSSGSATYFSDAAAQRSVKRFDGNKVRVENVRNEGFRHNGPAELAWAYSKYGKTLGSGAPANNRVSTGLVSAVNQSYDREYLSPVLIGTPGQVCWLDIDTGSGDLWLFSTDTPRFYLDGQQIYHPEKSRTSLRVSSASWSITYGDGSYAGGGVYRDTVTIGNISMLNATVESATAVSRSLTTDAVMSGILGLALDHPSTTYPQQQTLLQSMGSQLDTNLFAADLKYQDVGAYHFGYINDSSYTGAMTWRPVIPQSGFWEIYIQSIHIGGDRVWRMHNWPMVADTGTTLLLLPTDLVKLYWSFVPGAYMSEIYYGYVFPCNATLPAFDFGFSDRWNATIPGHYFNFEAISETECYGGIQDSMEPFGILGDAFLKALYVVFDMENKRVGLAKKKLAA